MRDLRGDGDLTSRAVRAALAAIALVGSVQFVQAATFEQIVADCRETVGRSHVMACMQSKRGTGDRESNLASCRAGAAPGVKACVQREAAKLAGTKAAPTMPTDNKVVAAKGAPAVPVGFAAPPRSIADITAILNREKPDAAKIAQVQKDADATPPKTGSATDRAQFYYDRGNARALLARNQEALADALKAMEFGKDVEFRLRIRLRQFTAIQYNVLGDPKQAIALNQATVREAERSGKGAMITASRSIAQTLISMGDLTQADTYAQKVAALVQQARGSPLPGWREAYAAYGRSWEADADDMRASLFEARGKFRDAELAALRAEAFRRASINDMDKWDYPPPPEQMLLASDSSLLTAARAKTRLGRLSEAEADARRALLEVLKNQGKYNPQTPKYVTGLAGILTEQGRYSDAERLDRSAVEIQQTLGMAADAPQTVSVLAQLAGVLVLQRKTDDAAQVYGQIETATSKWEPQRRAGYEVNSGRIVTLYATGRLDEGIAAAQEQIKRVAARRGEAHFDTAAARGTLAMGLALAGRDAEAIREFRAAMPTLTAGFRDTDSDDATVVAARNQRMQRTVESYIGLLARNQKDSGGAEVAVETFRLADMVRGRSVQQALAASSARMVAKDPALADLVRQEQDLSKQLTAQLGTLNNVLALPSGERDENGVRAINAEIERLRLDRAKAQAEIARQFPSYADLINPKPPTVDDIRAALKPGEAMLSFYFGGENSFVWAIPKDGPIAFAAVGSRADEIEAKIHKLREALEPNAATLGDIPAFDLALAYELYSKLLAPVEAGWKPAKNLIVVTNGALGLLPLSLLPTAAVAVKAGDGPMFSEYRDVPWLARTHAVTIVPSAAALKTLRQLPPGSDKRQKLIAFGDPIFNADEETQAEAAEPEATVQLVALTRGMPLRRRAAPQTQGVDSAELGMLPRLPDTARELQAMALALEADPSKVLYLGKEANEQRVKTTDLSKFKIIAFATHGLVPGDLDGLTQPALALTAPALAGVDGDGLLTMEEILALKLDADWVVLSACNTAAGAGAGAEAASGLGRAFFYAGTRAILVTNWSVHSASARQLVSDLFHRQSENAALTRGEALRQAMVALIDGSGFTDGDGATVFSYAHPLFWAPYSIIGDGG